jgi:hypothetical protein
MIKIFSLKKRRIDRYGIKSGLYIQQTGMAETSVIMLPDISALALVQHNGNAVTFE